MWQHSKLKTAYPSLTKRLRVILKWLLTPAIQSLVVSRISCLMIVYQWNQITWTMMNICIKWGVHSKWAIRSLKITSESQWYMGKRTLLTRRRRISQRTVRSISLRRCMKQTRNSRIPKDRWLRMEGLNNQAFALWNLHKLDSLVNSLWNRSELICRIRRKES